MKNRLLAACAPIVLGAASLGGCATMPKTAEAAPPAEPAVPPAYSGIFAQPSALPFHAPDFSRITDADYQPAIEAGIAAQRAEAKAIATNPEPPTFQNTLVALATSGQLLSRVQAVFGQVQGANTNDTLDAVETATSPMLAALGDDIYLDPALYARVKAVYDQRAALGLDAEDAMLLETTHADFIHAGANLSDENKAQLKQINGRIAELETRFSQTLTNATAPKSPVFTDVKALAGLPEADVAAARDFAAKNGHPGAWQIALVNTVQQPALAFLSDRATRKALWDASLARSSGGDAFDTRATVLELAKLRARKAALLGLPDYATFAMYDRMTTDPAAAQTFLRDFVPALAATQSAEARELAAAARADGISGPLQPWDWSYYAEKVRKKRFDIDEAQLKPYFEVYNVLENGVFYAANQFYGLNFQRRTDLPTYHPDMRVYEVHDRDGSVLGLFYFDPFARPNKQGGAWMNNFVEQSTLLGDKPVISNTLNITRPAEGQPALATVDDVTTMFHEFGHALHGLLAHQKYTALSGTNTARDWVEFPSQFNENFARLPAVLKHYARHYQTGADIPRALLDRIDAAAKFNQGLGLGETVEAAMLDLDWHRLSPTEVPTDVGAFETAAEKTWGLRTDLIPPRYTSPIFRHIWSNGYSAGYHAYIWTEMLAHDGWDWVVKNGGMTRANGDHVRASFLGEGHTRPYSVMYRDFTGRDPQVRPMLVARGLVPPPR